MTEVQGEMRILSWEEQIESRGFCDIHDVTQMVNRHLVQCGVEQGQATVAVPGATAGVTTIEYEPGLLKDLPEFFERIIPEGAAYHHNDTWHDGNGFSHVRAALLKSSLTVPIVNGRLALGTWQQIVLLDFDNHPRNRTFIIQIMGI